MNKPSNAAIAAATEFQAPVASHRNVYSALAAAQMEMGAALKSANNPHFKSKYADLASVIDACGEALNRHGVAYYSVTLTAEDGSWVQRTTLSHGESDTSINCDVPLIIQKRDMQGFGSACTYARRYGLMALAGIAPEDDDGNAAAKAAPTDKDTLRRTNPDQSAIGEYVKRLTEAPDLNALKVVWSKIPKTVQAQPDVIEAKNDRKAALSEPIDETQEDQREPVLADDEVPY